MTVQPGQFYTRPYVLNYSAPLVTIDSTAVNLTMGTYANPLSLLHSLMAKAWNDATAEIDIKLSDGLLIGLYSNSGTIDIDWDNTDLRDLFGFTGASTTLTADTWVYATYTPQYCWIPGKQRVDQGMFYELASNWAAGEYSDDGSWVGSSRSGNRVKYRDIQYQRVITENLLRSATDSDAYQKERCLETFLYGQMTNNPSVSTYARSTGFWFYNDVNDAISDCTLSTTEPWSEATNIGTDFGHTDSPDRKVFCAAGEDALASVIGGPGMPAGLLRFNTGFSFRTATAPTWTYTDWAG